MEHIKTRILSKTADMNSKQVAEWSRLIQRKDTSPKKAHVKERAYATALLMDIAASKK
jgi:hypothetical protein